VGPYPSLVLSINCQTGMFDYRSHECFAEEFLRHPTGALGIIAATDNSYSFVNDTFVWGMIDNIWGGFLPDYGSDEVSYQRAMPAFSMSAGKYFLEKSSWPYNTRSKEITYYLFHYLGEPFQAIYTVRPRQLVVFHPKTITSRTKTLSVFSELNSFVSITIDGEIYKTFDGQGGLTRVDLPRDTFGKKIVVTATKRDRVRYQGFVRVLD
jgi:hypothetical protein